MDKLSAIYAQSLFELAQEAGRSKEILEDTQALLTVLKDNPDFVRMLAAPVISAEEKGAVIDNVFAGKVDKTLLHYIKVMCDRKDVHNLAESLGKYEDLYNKHYGIEKAVAVTAVPMTKEQLERLTVKLEGLTGKTIVLTNEVDEKCLGGVILRLGDMQTDGSVATRLKELNSLLKTNC